MQLLLPTQAPFDTVLVDRRDKGPKELGEDQKASRPHATITATNYTPHPSIAGEINQPERGKPRSQKGTTCSQFSASVL